MNLLANWKSDTLTTAQLEQRIEQVKKDIVRYHEVEKSAELAEFLALQKIVETPEFQKNKNYLLTRKYKDTDEYKTLNRYRSLKLSPTLHIYYLILSYPNFKEYLEFAKSERYALLKDKNAVKESAELKKFQFIDRSWSLRNFRRCEKSTEVQDYLRLKEEVKSEDFIKRNAFWADPKRWYTTEEGKQDVRYLELKANPDIQFFLAQDAKKIAEWESYKTLYAEEFELTNLSQTAWKAGFYYNNKNLKTNHSYDNEQQAYNQGKNSHIGNSALCIETKKESTTATAWHPVKGFITKDFQWTGDVLQTAEAFQGTEGLFMAKVRVSGAAHAAVYLASGERTPLVKLMQWDGNEVSTGLRTEIEEGHTTIGGIHPEQWYVYSVRISDKEIVWYINNQEVMRVANTLHGVALYPAVATYIPQGANAGSGKVEIDWVRVYQN